MNSWANTTHEMRDYTPVPMGPMDDDCAIAWLLWCDLRESLREQCHRHNHNDETPVFAYDHPSTLTLEYITRAVIVLHYHPACCCPGDHRLRISFDADLLHLRFAIEGDPCPQDWFAVVRNDDPHFETREHRRFSPQEAGRVIADSLLARFMHTGPPKKTYRLSDLYRRPLAVVGK